MTTTPNPNRSAEAGAAVSRAAMILTYLEIYSIKNESNIRTGFTGWRLKAGSTPLPLPAEFPIRLEAHCSDGTPVSGMLEGTLRTVYVGELTFEELAAIHGQATVDTWVSEYHERTIDAVKIATNVKMDLPPGVWLAMADSQVPLHFTREDGINRAPSPEV